MVLGAVLVGVGMVVLGAALIGVAPRLLRRGAVMWAAIALGYAVALPGLVLTVAACTTDEWTEMTPDFVKLRLFEREPVPHEQMGRLYRLPVPKGKPWDGATLYERQLWYFNLRRMHEAWYELATNHPTERLDELLPVIERMQEINSSGLGGLARDAWPVHGLEWDLRDRAELEDAARALPVGLWAASETESMEQARPQMKWDLVHPPVEVLRHFASLSDTGALYAIGRAESLAGDAYRALLEELAEHPTEAVAQAASAGLERQRHVDSSMRDHPGYPAR